MDFTRQQQLRQSEDPLLDHALTSIGSGGSHVTEARDWVAAAHLAGAGSDSVLGFLRLGNFGRHDQNLERDLYRSALGKHGIDIEPYCLYLKLQMPDAKKPQMVRIATLAPHEVLHALWKAGSIIFSTSLLGESGQAGISEWWHHVHAEPWYRNHPDLQDRRLWPWLIPGLFFFDGAEVHQNTEYYIWLFGSAVVRGSPLDCKFVIAAIPVKWIPTKEIKDIVFTKMARYIGWCVGCLASGLGPVVGFYKEDFDKKEKRFQLRGQPLAGGFRVVFAGFKADLKARRESHFFSRHPQCMFICDECMATQAFKRAPKALNYTDCSEDALWLQTMQSSGGHDCRSPWRHVRGWCLGLNYRDNMHNEYLGLCRDLCANLLWELDLCGNLVDAATLDERLRAEHVDMLKWCKDFGFKRHAGNVFSAASLKLDSKYPELSSTYKAAAVKTLCIYLGHRWSTAETSSQHVKLVVVCAWSYAEYLRVLDMAGRYMNSQERERAYWACGLFLRCYTQLSDEAWTSGKYLWKCRPKLHYVDHVRRRLKLSCVNPRFMINWAEEGMMGCMKRIGSKCHGATASHRMLQRYLLYMSRRWAARRREGTFVSGSAAKRRAVMLNKVRARQHQVINNRHDSCLQAHDCCS